MSLLSFILKSKKDMAKENTRPIRIGRYTLSKHVQNRIVNPTREVTKCGVISNLLRKPLGLGKIKIDSKNRLSYERIGDRVVTAINPLTNVVATVRKTNLRDARKYNLRMKRNKRYAKN